jgi:hypothetical protein
MHKTVIRYDPDKTEKALSHLATSTDNLSACPKIMNGSDKLAGYCSHGGCDTV